MWDNPTLIQSIYQFQNLLKKILRKGKYWHNQLRKTF